MALFCDFIVEGDAGFVIEWLIIPIRPADILLKKLISNICH